MSPETAYVLLLATVITFFVARWAAHQVIDAWAARRRRHEQAKWSRRHRRGAAR